MTRMLKRVMAITVTSTLSLGGSWPAFADQDQPSVKKSIVEIAGRALASADQARPNAPSQSDDNPYFLPAVILMAGGGAVTLYGLTHDTGVACTSGTSSFSCGVTKSKVTIFAGLGMVGVGAFLFYKGKNHPNVVFGPRMIGVRQQFIW